MADYAPNFTARYRLRYSVLGHQHTQQWRIARSAGVTGLNNMVLKVAAFWNALMPVAFASWTELSATYAAEDSDIFLPAAVPTISTGSVAETGNLVSESIFSTGFVGRSALGQKARVFCYGVNLTPESAATTGDNFRVTSGESTAVSNAIVVLNNGSPNVVGSDNAVVSWYSYANGKYNDYWLRQVR